MVPSSGTILEGNFTIQLSHLLGVFVLGRSVRVEGEAFIVAESNLGVTAAEGVDVALALVAWLLPVRSRRGRLFLLGEAKYSSSSAKLVSPPSPSDVSIVSSDSDISVVGRLRCFLALLEEAFASILDVDLPPRGAFPSRVAFKIV